MTEKIRKQKELLNLIGRRQESEQLATYINEIQVGDKTNREDMPQKYILMLFSVWILHGQKIMI